MNHARPIGIGERVAIIAARAMMISLVVLTRLTGWARRLSAPLLGAMAMVACASDDGASYAGELDAAGAEALDGAAGAAGAAADGSESGQADVFQESGDEEGEAAPQCTPKTCAQLGASCGSVPDGCGDKLECGDCPDGQACGGGGANNCGTDACMPKSCAQVGVQCGWASDGCSQAMDCGGCPAPETCGGAGAPNVCGCKPKTCAQLGASCGTTPDGCKGTVSCGTCMDGQACGGGGPNICGTSGCTPKSCAQLEASCGFISDGCSDVVDCGACVPPHQCGGAGVANQCGCTPKTCAHLGASCGMVDTGCGEISCGSCAPPDTCGGGGAANQCGCTCAVPNATTSCLAGVCSITLCASGWVDCDKQTDSGCEVQLASDPNNCGSCGKLCSFANASATCAAGACKLGACSAGFGNCDAQAANGCEINLNSSVSNCGSCGKVCSLAHASATCSSGVCQVSSCSAGYGNCDGVASNGCEAAYATDTKNCGKCGRACPGACVDGLCEYTSADTARKWDQSYKGSGVQYTYDTTKNYQGYYLADNGVFKSAIGAPDQMFTDLAGATVLDIWVYMYAAHWYYFAGGTARIGVHGNSSKPTTFPGINQDYAVDFARDEGKWVRLPTTWYASFKSGAYRGITLHAANSTSGQYYGYMTASATKWRWKYRK